MLTDRLARRLDVRQRLLVLLRLRQQHDAEVELVARADQVLLRQSLQQLTRLGPLTPDHQRVRLSAEQHHRVRLMHQPRGLHEIDRRRLAVADLELQHALLQGQPGVRREELHHRPVPQASEQLRRAVPVRRLDRESEALEPPSHQRRQQQEHADARQDQPDPQRRPRHQQTHEDQRARHGELNNSPLHRPATAHPQVRRHDDGRELNVLGSSHGTVRCRAYLDQR